MQSRLLQDLSNRLFAGSAMQLALHALSMEPASENELAELRALIDHKRNTESSKASRLIHNSRKDRP